MAYLEAQLDIPVLVLAALGRGVAGVLLPAAQARRPQHHPVEVLTELKGEMLEEKLVYIGRNEDKC